VDEPAFGGLAGRWKWVGSKLGGIAADGPTNVKNIKDKLAKQPG
jgi:hypothetical protein